MRFWLFIPVLTLLASSFSVRVHADRSEQEGTEQCKKLRDSALKKALDGRDPQKQPLTDAEKIRAEAAFKIGQEVSQTLVAIAKLGQAEKWRERLEESRRNNKPEAEEILFREIVVKTQPIASHFLGHHAWDVPKPEDSIHEMYEEEFVQPDPHGFFRKGLFEKSGHWRDFSVEKYKPSIFSKAHKYTLEVCIGVYCTGSDLEPTGFIKPEDARTALEIWAKHPELPKDLLILYSRDGERAFLENDETSRECFQRRPQVEEEARKRR